MSSKKIFKINAQVWVYPGLAGWHFITLDKKFSKDIRAQYKTGFVKVEVRIGKTSWDTSLFPHKQSEAYLLCIKASVRKKESIFEGDNITILFRII